MDAKHLSVSAKVRAEILRLDLQRHPEFDSLTVSQFAAIYNGIGPDDWPEALREAMTFIYRNFTPLPGVHDVDFYFADGSRAGFDSTLSRWRHNSSVLLDDRYPRWKFWTWKLREIAWIKLLASYEALEHFSGPVYIDAARRAARRDKAASTDPLPGAVPRIPFPV